MSIDVDLKEMSVGMTQLLAIRRLPDEAFESLTDEQLGQMFHWCLTAKHSMEQGKLRVQRILGKRPDAVVPEDGNEKYAETPRRVMTGMGDRPRLAVGQVYRRCDDDRYGSMLTVVGTTDDFDVRVEIDGNLMDMEAIPLGTFLSAVSLGWLVLVEEAT